MLIKQLSQLPKVDGLMREGEMVELVEKYSYRFVKGLAQAEISKRRHEILKAEGKVNVTKESFLKVIAARCKSAQAPQLQSVINATGVVLHTNLGRAPLTEKIKEKLNQISFGYSNLEYDLAKGQRGSRYQHLEKDLLTLTGAEGALVVNNNAAAVLLALQTFIQGKEIIISRGELVEIGGSFRIPDIIALSGGLIREVGTTNKTHLKDYEKAINENTGAILKVHTSNYKIVGFTEDVSNKDLAELAHRYDLPMMNDLGSGLLVDLTEFGLPYEPTVMECVADGADIITFSGDKLLGGPQAGLIVGKTKYLKQMKENPLVRALRVDKMTLIALEITLKEYLKPESVIKSIPTLNLLTLSEEEIYQKAILLKEQLVAANLPLSLEIVSGYSQVGGGSYPGTYLKTKIVTCNGGRVSAEKIAARLRSCQPPIITRIKDHKIQFDLRTLALYELPLIVRGLKEVLSYEPLSE